jgi:hypothetical protein
MFARAIAVRFPVLVSAVPVIAQWGTSQFPTFGRAACPGSGLGGPDGEDPAGPIGVPTDPRISDRAENRSDAPGTL